MALSKQSTQETTNLARIAEIILSPCTDVLRDVLTKQMRHFKVEKQFESFLNRSQVIRCFFGDKGLHEFSKIKDNPHFNIPLLYASLRCICSISPHNNKWGNFPDEQDRSLSANIERIYSLHKKYGQHQYDHLKDSIFEQEWKNVYQTVKELEEYLGSDTKYQETLKKMKTSLIDPDVGKKIIKNLRDVKSSLANTFLELEKEEPGMKYHAMESELREEETKLRIEFASDSESEYIDKSERTKPITSKQLRMLFNSFELKIPDDPLIESFASGIVHKDVHNLMTEVNSLSNGVVLSTNTSSNTALIFEMEVVDDGDQLCVVKKDNSSYAFQHFLDEDNPTKVILITSKSLSIVKAKLMVYKKYKHIINERKLFLQHEYEEFDDVAKMVAYQKLMSFCSSVESVINAFSVDLYKIVTDYVGKPLTANKIKEMCLKAFNESLHHRSFITEMLQRLEKTEGDRIELEPTKEVREKMKRMETTGRDWRDKVATKIHQKISEKGEMKCTDAWSEIWNACRKTVDDLGIILSGLEEFLARVLPVDQNKQIDEWLKMEVAKDNALLHEYSSIKKFIAGQRDDKNVVKVYLSGDITEEAKKAFNQNCKLENTDFEFVNIEGKKEMPKEIKRIKALERKAPAIEKSTIKVLKKIIREHTEKLYASYSNIIGIRIGRRVHGDKLEEPCIIFYCLDKTLIPFGEKKLPDTLEGWPCDVREDFIMFGMCTQNCSADRPELGCSIGRRSSKGSGSAGFMYESKNSDKYRSGFLTASHVAIKECHKLYNGSAFLSNHPLGQNKHIIVHPSWEDNAHVDNPVGEVVESFFGNNEFSEGLDFAAVKTKKRREGEKETVEIYNEDDELSEKMVKVTKIGRTTGTTVGELDGEMESIIMEHPAGSGRCYIFYSPYVVYSIPEERQFFEPGDSGSGVFVVEKTKEGDKPGKAVGILFAGAISEEAYVCKISRILDTLGLTIVRSN